MDTKRVLSYLISIMALFIISSQIAVAAISRDLLPNERNTIAVFKKASPLVVNVHRLRTVMNRGFNLQDVQTGMGSGFLWNSLGYVVTNYHVIRGASKLAVTLQKGETVRATLVGSDPRRDIAVLKLVNIKPLKDLPDFNHFPLANSSTLAVGQKTIAIGNPFGLDRTLTTGVISALGREIPGIGGNIIRNMIQTDASINPGNSGGPLLNSEGRLIGMNTSIYSRSGGSAGIGFAVPVNEIKRVVNQLIYSGRVRQPGIGVEVLSDSIAEQIGVTGIIINRVRAGSPAQKAGLKGTVRDTNGKIHIGDIIVGINGHAVKNLNELYAQLDKINVGQKIELSYKRNGKMHKINIRTIDVS